MVNLPACHPERSEAQSKDLRTVDILTGIGCAKIPLL